jgi:hypothetical protein
VKDTSLRANRVGTKWLISTFLICALISVATLIRRALVLATPRQSGHLKRSRGMPHLRVTRCLPWRTFYLHGSSAVRGGSETPSGG